MANPQHLEALRKGSAAWALWREDHPDTVPDLSRAQLAGVDLQDSDLIDADLSSANLRRAKLAKCNLAGARLGGADLTGAQLPEVVSKQLESLNNVRDISSNAQKLFIAVLAACLYSWLTIGSTTDANLLTNRATSSLPIIQTAIPIVGFFYVAPLLLFGAYLYLHFYLQKLWDQLGSLPAIFPDGKPLHEKTDPWLLSDLVRIHSQPLRDSAPFLANIQIFASVFLTWWVVPLTLLMFWGRYLVRHEPAGTLFQLFACAASVSSAIFLYRLASRTLRGVEPRPFQWRSDIRLWKFWAPVITCLWVAILLAAVSFGAIRGARSGDLVDNYWPDRHGPRTWLPRALAFLRLSPFADLRGAELSVKPPNWSSGSNSALAVKGIPLSGMDLRFADMRASFLRNALLTDTVLRNADLLGSDLEQAGMIGTDLSGASLANADLRKASLVRANLEGADVKYAHFEEAQGLTADQMRGADSWCEAFYDANQLQMLGLPVGNNEQVRKWLLFDRENSSSASPSTLQAAREADLRRFTALPEFEQESVAPVSAQQADRSPASLAADNSSANSIRSVPDLQKIYNFPAGLDGAGQTIALIELDGGYLDSDLDRYFRDLNLKKPRVTSVSVDGHTNHPGGPVDAQVEGDIEVAGSVAPGANIVVYFSGSDSAGYFRAIQAVAEDQVHHATVLSIGWGMPEGSPFWKGDIVKKMNQVLEAAANRGITVVVASGDHGARDEATEKRLRVDFPASSPWVLAVGGTKLVSLGSGFTEVAWNDAEFLGASGGGVSEVFEQPKWQSHIRVPHSLSTRTGRGVPDVAINASTMSGYRLVIHGVYGDIGGTSIGAPMWAGLIALLNQGTGRNLGFFNPLLYEKLGPQGVLRSVISGHNGIGELSGYCAGPGWNAVTGWGTPDGTRLLEALTSLRR
jgi:kumamolisin